MKMAKMKFRALRFGSAAAALVCMTSLAQAQQPSIPERVAALKTTLAGSKAALKNYEWIETTVITLKGEEKVRKQQKCYYGADGGIQKLDVSAQPEPEQKRGVRGRIVARKTEEMTDYMKNAVNLVKTYVPPDPAKIQSAKDAGKVTLEILEPGKRVRLNFADYHKPGDRLGVEVDLMTNRLLEVTVSSFLDDPTDAVKLQARMGQLSDGTAYTSSIALDAVAKNLGVTVENSGYKKVN